MFRRAMFTLSMLTGLMLSGVMSAAPALAEQAPDFQLRSPMDNQSVKLSDLQGKVVLMNFWATWCAPCMAEMPHLQQMYTDLKEQGFEVISISIDDARDRSKIKPLVKSKGLDFTILWDQGSRVSQVYNPSGVVPMTVIIDKEGNIIEKKTEYAAGEECELRKTVIGLLEIEDPNVPEQCKH
ncbi:MAG: TlpA disulfide reductase family protein [Myxococcota bacterium]